MACDVNVITGGDCKSLQASQVWSLSVVPRGSIRVSLEESNEGIFCCLGEYPSASLLGDGSGKLSEILGGSDISGKGDGKSVIWYWYERGCWSGDAGMHKGFG